MPILNFSLSPDATARVYELLVCLAKFGENVAIEARGEKASSIRTVFPGQTADYHLADLHHPESLKDSVFILCAGCEELLHQI